jgi:hypothetical protein
MDDDFSWVDDTPELETDKQLPRPVTMARYVAKRQFVAGLKREALNELIPILPPPDMDLYIIGNGAGAEVKHGINPQAFDFGSFIPHVVRMLGDRECTAYISTWTMNHQHGLTMLEMLDDGRLKALTLCTDPYWKRREAAVANQVITGLMTRNQRYVAFKNHVKCIAIAAPESVSGSVARTCVITGSANLSAQPRCEQYVLTTSPVVYQFFQVEFFEEMFARVNNG